MVNDGFSLISTHSPADRVFLREMPVDCPSGFPRWHGLFFRSFRNRPRKIALRFHIFTSFVVVWFHLILNCHTGGTML